MYWTVEYHLISQSEQNHHIGAILTGKWAKKQKGKWGGETKQRGRKCSTTNQSLSQLQ